MKEGSDRPEMTTVGHPGIPGKAILRQPKYKSQKEYLYKGSESLFCVGLPEAG